MDIFDTFFLVEYLRQWAARGRIVVLTLQPPTYEILTMISKVAVISTGRLMYYGKRREMLPYFAFIEYPCPAYKNPADYYREFPKNIFLLNVFTIYSNSIHPTIISMDIPHFYWYLHMLSDLSEIAEYF